MFSFRQRVGKLNWKILSSIDIDHIIQEANIAELQSLIDIVTFSDFTPADVKNNTIEAISKLVNIMQLIVEYLLYCQESYNKLVHDLHEKNNSLRKKNQSLKKEVSSLNEDNKIYQRQLVLLRKSLIKAQQMIGGTSVPMPPRIVGESKSEFKPIIDSFLIHERETRVFLRTLLDEQRSTFFSEMQRFTKNENVNMNECLKEVKFGTLQMSENSLKDMTEKLCSHVEHMMSVTIESMQKGSTKLMTAIADDLTIKKKEFKDVELETSLETNRRKVMKQAELIDSLTDSLRGMERESGLLKKSLLEAENNSIHDKRQLDLLKQQHTGEINGFNSIIAQLQSELQNLKQAQVSRRGEEGTPAEQSLKIAAVTLLVKIVSQALLRRQLRGFRRWQVETVHERERKQLERHSHLLRVAAETHRRQEQDQQQSVEREREQWQQDRSRSSSYMQRLEDECAAAQRRVLELVEDKKRFIHLSDKFCVNKATMTSDDGTRRDVGVGSEVVEHTDFGCNTDGPEHRPLSVQRLKEEEMEERKVQERLEEKKRAELRQQKEAAEAAAGLLRQRRRTVLSELPPARSEADLMEQAMRRMDAARGRQLLQTALPVGDPAKPQRAPSPVYLDVLAGDFGNRLNRRKQSPVAAEPPQAAASI